MEFKDNLTEARAIFHNLLFKEENPIVCSIHDIFHDPESDKHNCIGCNLAESIDSINSYFNRIGAYEEIQEGYNDLLIKLYLFVERAYELFKIMSLPQEYRASEFETFHLIHKWANFIKHPKAFMFCHTPRYAVGISEDNFDLIVDSEFVKKFYSGDKRNLELYKKLENNPSVVVLYPEAKRLIENFAEEVMKIEPLIANNQVYRDILHKKSTLEAYFEVEDLS